MSRYTRTVGPFTVNQLQAFAVLAGRAEQAGYVLDDFVAAVQADLDARAAGVVGRKTATPQPPVRQGCPSCGRGKLVPVVTAEALRVMGCKLCRYSEVVA